MTARNVDAGDLISAAGASGGAPLRRPSPTAPTTPARRAARRTTPARPATARCWPHPALAPDRAAPLFTIAQAGRLRIYVSVPEGYSDLVHHETDRGVALPGVSRPDVLWQCHANRGFHRSEHPHHAGRNPGRQREGPAVAGHVCGRNLPRSQGRGPAAGLGRRHRDPRRSAHGGGHRRRQGEADAGRDRPAIWAQRSRLCRASRKATSSPPALPTKCVRTSRSRPRQNKKQAEQQNQQKSVKPNPPGGSTQYGDAGIEDQDMQGQNAQAATEAAG